MQERDIEARLRDRVLQIGGTAYKFVSPGKDGVPDRLICLPGGRCVFVELKATGKKSSPRQRRQQIALREMGFIVYSDIDSYQKVEKVVAECKDIMRRPDHYYAKYFVENRSLSEAGEQ